MRGRNITYIGHWIVRFVFLLLFVGQDVSAQERMAPSSPSHQSGANADNTEASTDNRLEEAYKREFAFLEAQRRALRQRLNHFEATKQKETGKLHHAIENLEDQLLSLSVQSERLQDQLQEAERITDTNAGNNDILESTFDHAGTTLRKYGSTQIDTHTFNALDDEAKIGQIFDMAASIVRRLSSVRKTQGSFYLQDGTKTEGTLIKVGNIATYGISNDGGGVLAPAGGGELQLWPKPTLDVATALANDQSPEMLTMFLYESLNRQMTADEDKTLVNLIESGGLIAWIIVGLGIVALLLILLRTFFLKTASASAGNIIHTAGTLVKEGKFDQALQECRRNKGSAGRVVAATIRNLDRDRDHLEDIISETILTESSRLNRFGSFILVLAAVSPLLGLLGTVTGMIETFSVITEFGTGDPKLLSGGISTALVTTELGLAVAIPILIIGNLLSGWGERIKDDMEKTALRIMNLSHEKRQATCDLESQPAV